MPNTINVPSSNKNFSVASNWQDGQLSSHHGVTLEQSLGEKLLEGASVLLETDTSQWVHIRSAPQL